MPSHIPVTNCFYAYAARPREVTEILEDAINQINAIGQCKIQGWKESTRIARPVITSVCEAIDKCDLFLCDLTSLNPNVLFELGYAIAKNKHIWFSLNETYDQSVKDFKDFAPLSTFLYAVYRNTTELVRRFFEDQPFETATKQTLYENMFQNMPLIGEKPYILYLKCIIPTEASVRLTQRLSGTRSAIPLRTDDPDEVISQPITWYVQSLRNAFGVVVHLLDDNRAKSFPLHNPKCSLISGIAYGLKQPLQMLAHAPFEKPIDYRDLLQIHETAAECSNIINYWLQDIEQRYSSELKNYREQQSRIRTAGLLHDLSLGEYVAENESEQLLNYFISTAEYEEAFRTQLYNIYVGRKGVGKTANLYKIADEVKQDARMHVCIVKPIDYDLSGVLELLARTGSRSEQGNLINSLWKFLIYTELAQSVFNAIEQRPLYASRTEAEQVLVDFVMEHPSLINADFTLRMSEAISQLCRIDFSQSIDKQRVKVSEILHNSLLARLREVLGNVLQKKERVFILVDNLDKAWGEDTDLGLLSLFLFDLLNTVKTIADDFTKSGFRKHSINLCLIIFLRSDIFAYIKKTAREADKLVYTRIKWDQQLLPRVIEERFVSYAGYHSTPEQVWQQFFVDQIDGTATKEYIVSRIIPRPRDIIFLCKMALAYAVNHRHLQIEQDDIIEAEKDYSDYAFKSLLVEVRPQIRKIEELLYQFVDAPEIVTRSEVDQFIQKAKIPKTKWNAALELLCDATFLGLEVEHGVFEFIYDENRREIVRQRARKLVETQDEQRFRINIPFQAYLEVRTTPPLPGPSASYQYTQATNAAPSFTLESITEGSVDFLSFFERVSPGNQPVQILVITYFYQYVNHVEHLTLEHYHEAYNALQKISIQRPVNLKSSVRNVVDRTEFLTNAARGTYILTQKGIQFIESILHSQ